MIYYQILTVMKTYLFNTAILILCLASVGCEKRAYTSRCAQITPGGEVSYTETHFEGGSRVRALAECAENAGGWKYCSLIEK